MRIPTSILILCFTAACSGDLTLPGGGPDGPGAPEPDRVRTQADEVRRFVERQLDDSGAGEADLDLLLYGKDRKYKMAIGNIRERLKLHFDAEGALESRVRDSTYEVHIRMPYRSVREAQKTEAGATVPGERRSANRRSAEPHANGEGPRTIAGGSAGASRG